MASEIQSTEPNTDADSINTTSAASSTTTNTSPQSIFTALHNYQFINDPAFLAGLSQIFGHPGTALTEAELSQKPDLVLSAKCFYFSRKLQTPEPIDPAAYKAWLASSSLSQDAGTTAPQPNPASNSTYIPPPSISAASVTNSTPPTADPLSTVTSSDQATPQPLYPTSFAAIVELITNNKPIPGIEEIPTTVLERGSSKQDIATRRRKPWEKDVDTGVESDTGLPLDSSMGTEGPGGGSSAAAIDQRQTRNSDEDGLSGVDGVDATDTFPAEQGEGLLRLLRPDAVPDSGLVAKE